MAHALLLSSVTSANLIIGVWTIAIWDLFSEWKSASDFSWKWVSCFAMKWPKVEVVVAAAATVEAV